MLTSDTAPGTVPGTVREVVWTATLKATPTAILELVLTGVARANLDAISTEALGSIWKASCFVVRKAIVSGTVMAILEAICVVVCRRTLTATSTGTWAAAVVVLQGKRGKVSRRLGTRSEIPGEFRSCPAPVQSPFSRIFTTLGTRNRYGESGDSPTERLRRTQRGTVPIFAGHVPSLGALDWTCALVKLP